MDTFLRFRCPSCGKRLKTRTELVGRSANCPCGKRILISDPTQPIQLESTPKQKSRLLEVWLTMGIVLMLLLTGILVWQRGVGQHRNETRNAVVDPTAQFAQLKSVALSQLVEPVTEPYRSDTVESGVEQIESPARQITPPLTEAQPAPRNIPVTVTTNVYGGSLVVKTSEREILRKAFPQHDQSIDVEVPDINETCIVSVELAGVVALKSEHRFTANEKIDVIFSESLFSELHRAGGCLLRLPGGGFGSGFLFGDRQTIATAAHCVACENVGEIEIVFHPCESRCFQFEGAQIIYFDSAQDVALLHLPTPVSDSQPYFWTQQAAEKEESVSVLGNPGRAGFPDPMYCRSAHVKGIRPDEFFIDIEVKPGYSGGPVIRENSMNVVGITSYKFINTESYENDGQSFAKSAMIAADAYTHWSHLSSELRASKLDREQRQYTQRFQYIEANEVAAALVIDSLQYVEAINAVIADYEEHMERALDNLPDAVTEGVLRRQYQQAHRDYLRNKGSAMGEKIKEEISPKLLLERGYGERYDRILENQKLPQELKSHLKKAHRHYETIREALENVVTPSRRSSGGKTLQEFAEFIVEEMNGALSHSQEVMAVCEGFLQ